MEIKEALQTLGLSDKESAVYLALLQLGRGSAYSIAAKSGLKNPTTYVILDELIKKGLVQRVPRVRKQLYVALSPEQAFGAAEEKLSVAKQMLPQLLALTKGEGTRVSAAYFEGLEGVKQMMEFGLKEAAGGEVVGFYAIAPENNSELNEYFKEWNDKRKKLRIKMRGIAPEHKSLSEYRKDDVAMDREFRTVPFEQFSSEIAIDATDSVVRIHDYKNLQGVVIENREVAKTVKEIFEMVWQSK